MKIDLSTSETWVAILILLELTLQFGDILKITVGEECRNPYFIGINSAIASNLSINMFPKGSQSLFYWN